MRRQAVGRRLYVAIIIMLMLVVSIAAGCVEVSYPVKETYWENTTVSENHSETFSQVVPIVRAVSGEQALTPNIVWSNPELEYNGLSHFGITGIACPSMTNPELKYYFLNRAITSLSGSTCTILASEGKYSPHRLFLLAKT